MIRQQISLKVFLKLVSKSFCAGYDARYGYGGDHEEAKKTYQQIRFEALQKWVEEGLLDLYEEIRSEAESK